MGSFCPLGRCEAVEFSVVLPEEKYFVRRKVSLMDVEVCPFVGD